MLKILLPKSCAPGTKGLGGAGGIIQLWHVSVGSSTGRLEWLRLRTEASGSNPSGFVRKGGFTAPVCQEMLCVTLEQQQGHPTATARLMVHYEPPRE